MVPEGSSVPFTDVTLQIQRKMFIQKYMHIFEWYKKYPIFYHGTCVCAGFVFNHKKYFPIRLNLCGNDLCRSRGQGI